MKRRNDRAFTLIELLVVMPYRDSCRDAVPALPGQGQVAVNQVRLEYAPDSLAVTMHADEGEGVADRHELRRAQVVAAPDLGDSGAGLSAVGRCSSARRRKRPTSAATGARSWHPIGYNGATTFDPRGVEGAATKPKLVACRSQAWPCCCRHAERAMKRSTVATCSARKRQANQSTPPLDAADFGSRSRGGDERQTTQATQAGDGAARGQRRRHGPEQPRLGRRPCGSPDRLVDPATGRGRKPGLGFREEVSEPGQTSPRAGWVN